MTAILQCDPDTPHGEQVQERAVMDADYFGPMLRRLREERGWNQAEFAERCGLSQPTIARIERGKRIPGWETVLALCAALDVSCEAFRPPPGWKSPKKPKR